MNNTATISLEEYNRLRDIETNYRDGKVLVEFGSFRDRTIYYYSNEEVAAEHDRLLGNNKDLEKDIEKLSHTSQLAKKSSENYQKLCMDKDVEIRNLLEQLDEKRAKPKPKWSFFK